MGNGYSLVRIAPVASIVGLLLVMMTTDPTENITSILLVFLLLYVLFVSVFFVVLHHLWHRIAPGVRPQLSRLRSYYIASALGVAPVSLIAMQSLQQVRFFDVALVGVLLGLVIFYIVKRTS